MIHKVRFFKKNLTMNQFLFVSSRALPVPSIARNRCVLRIRYYLLLKQEIIICVQKTPIYKIRIIIIIILKKKYI